jgi:hypothetical protein
MLSFRTLSDAEKKEGWKLLFDGKTFNGWRSYFETMDPSKGLSIEAGCFKNSKGNGRPRSGGGDIMTAELLTDFDFRFEWSMPPVRKMSDRKLEMARRMSYSIFLFGIFLFPNRSIGGLRQCETKRF